MLKHWIVPILVFASAPRIARANDWRELGQDSAGSHGSTEISDPQFSPSWSYALNSGPVVSTPVLSGGTLVLAGSGMTGVVAALKAADGSVNWTRSLPGGVNATPAIAADRVTVPSVSGQLYSLNLSDGSIAWQQAFGGQNYSSPILVPRATPGDADTILIGAGFPAQDVYRFNALTGDQIWKTPKGAIADLVYSSAAVVGSGLVIGIEGGRFQSLDLTTGVTNWKYDATGAVNLSSPLVVGNRVYMFPGDAKASLFAVDASTGAAVSGFPVSIPDEVPVPGGQMFGQGPPISSPTMVGGKVIVQFRRQDMPSTGKPMNIVVREFVAAIDPETARVAWQYSFANKIAPTYNDIPGGGLCATPAGFVGTKGAYVAVSSSISGRVAILDVATGQELWTSTLSAPGRSSPVFSNGQLFVATDDSVLHAFSSMSNRAPTPPSVVAPAGPVAFAPNGNDLSWLAGSDPEGGSLSYMVRVEKDGAPETRTYTSTTVGSTRVSVTLAPNTSYQVAVRSRDAQGALSPWSVSQKISVGDAAPAIVVEPSDGTMVGMAPPPPAPSTDTPAPTPTPSPASPPPACAPMMSADEGASEAAASAAHAMAETTASGSASAPLAQPTSGAAGTTSSSSAALATGASAEGTSQDDSMLPAAMSVTQADLAPRGGCSVAGGRESGACSWFGLGLLAVVLRRRATRTASTRF